MSDDVTDIEWPVLVEVPTVEGNPPPDVADDQEESDPKGGR